MWQTKYASAVPKNLGLGLNCSEGSLDVRSPWVGLKIKRVLPSFSHLEPAVAFMPSL